MHSEFCNQLYWALAVLSDGDRRFLSLQQRLIVEIAKASSSLSAHTFVSILSSLSFSSVFWISFSLVANAYPPAVRRRARAAAHPRPGLCRHARLAAAGQQEGGGQGTPNPFLTVASPVVERLCIWSCSCLFSRLSYVVCDLTPGPVFCFSSLFPHRSAGAPRRASPPPQGPPGDPLPRAHQPRVRFRLPFSRREMSEERPHKIALRC